MALSPLEPIEERVDEIDATPEPSKTYRLNTNGTIGGIIDGDEALRQFIAKAVRTARLRFPIYDDEYGSELESYIGADVTQELLEAELPDVITDALIYDDRIADVANVEISRNGDKAYIEITVVKADGEELTEGVIVNGD